MFERLAQTFHDAQRDFSEISRLFSEENTALRRLVFYSEGAFHYRYFEDYINYVLDNSDLSICYITSESNDPVFSLCNKRIRPFFIKNTLGTAFSRLDSKVVVMTAPDLGNCFIKPARQGVHHIYAMHGVSSVHMGYRQGAFDNYESVLCLGQFQIEELRKSEAVYRTKHKDLILTGYPFLEQLNRKYMQYRSNTLKRDTPLCVIAPTWSPLLRQSSIMDSCVLDLVHAFADSEFRVWLRPHPEYIKRHPKEMQKVMQALGKSKNLTLETKLPSLSVLFDADVMITDHSSIAFDFAFGTERPLLFIDTPTRVDNPNWQRIGMDVVETTFRSKIGTSLSVDQVKQAPDALRALLSRQEEFHAKLLAARNELIANWGQSAEVGGKHILAMCGC
jgi:YidC/Oxa1 family membrane protein insertase